MRAARRTFSRLARRPGQNAVAVAALALGIGLTGAMAAIVQGSFLRGLPFEDADRIVHVGRRPLAEGGVLAAEAQAWADAIEQGEAEGLGGVERVAAWIGTGGVWNGDDEPAERRNGAYATPELFRVTGVSPTLGRALEPGDDLPGAEPVVVISDALWRERYRSDPQVLGRTVRIAGDPATIVGVMPPGFQFPLRQEFWLPLGPLTAQTPGVRLPVQVAARLALGAPAERAALALDGVADRAAAAAGDDPATVATAVTPFVAAYTEDARKPLWLAAGAVVCVLLIACANVANLLLARGLARSEELAVRAALGAGRRRIAGALLGEAAALALLGGALGLGVAWGAVRLYRSELFGGGLVGSFWADVRLDPASLAVIVAATLLTALAAGTVPALRAGRVAPARVLSRARALAGADRGRAGWAPALVVGQIALSSALLVGTALMLESVRGLYAHDFGERPERVWTAGVHASSGGADGEAAWLRTYDELARRVRAIPGVRSAALVSHLPACRTGSLLVEIEGAAQGAREPAGEARFVVAGPGYFETLGRPPLAGRGFDAGDRPESDGGEPVVVVDREFAERFLGGVGEAVGRRVRFSVPGADAGDPAAWRRVVGVVPSLLLDWKMFEAALAPGTPPGVYFPLAQSPQPGMTLVARIAGERSATDLAPEVRRALAAVDPDVPLLDPRTLADAISLAAGDHRRVQALLSLFAAAALALAGLGLYGVLSFTVGARLRELGIRAALGARRIDLATRIGRTALVQVALGLATGLAAGVAGSRLLEGLLYGVRPGSPTALATAAAVLLAAATLACTGPLLRAARLDPASVLRAD